MRISSIESFPVPPRWLFVKVMTDEGQVGWGEATLEGHARAVSGAVEDAAEALMGHDAACIEDAWQLLYRARFYRGGPVLMSAMSGIDQALWDIKGKTLGVPVYELLGGRVRDAIQVYSWIGGDRPSDLVAAAQERLRAGFTAVKMNATEEVHWVQSGAPIDDAVERVAEVRSAMGSEFGIAVDFHGRVHKGVAKVLARELEPFNLLFIEEPVLPDHPRELRDIASHVATPIAVGERTYSRWGFRPLLDLGCVDIIQPDASHAGGISEVRRIAAMAEAYDVAVALHCPLGPIALAACLQLDGCTPNAFIQEQSLGMHYNESADLLDYVSTPDAFRWEGGNGRIPTGPGLGIEVDEERVRKAALGAPLWTNPVWRLPDGSVTEW
jgi:galactonate dehydratase